MSHLANLSFLIHLALRSARPLLLLTVLITGFSHAPSAYAADWTTRINFNELAFPSASTNLLSAEGTTTMAFDIFSGSGAPGVEPIDGADGTIDLTVVVTLVESVDNPWSKTEADFSTASLGSFRSDWMINSSDCSHENAYAYTKFDFYFSGALANIQAGQFTTKHTSTNGESEGYEFTLITTNGVGNTTIESQIGTYTNTQYVAGESMSEHIFGVSDPDAHGGPVVNNPGVWTVDDLNTTVDPDVDEAPTTNPASGSGGTNDDQEVDGTDFGLNVGDTVSQITYFFGLQDVAFDTDGDGCTQTNTLPSAGVTWFDIGYEGSTAVELGAFTAQQGNDDVAVTWTTVSEVDHAGFNLYSSFTNKGPWTQINDRLIPAQGEPFESATYTYTNKVGEAGRYYLLEDVDLKGNITRHAPILSSIALIDGGHTVSRLYLPIVSP